MSFKREGDDTNLLQKLRKRRITELLSEDIPEDEAKLLCNGRFACTVCPNNPIFDTVNVLSMHRNGKKHLANLEIHQTKKRELNQLIATRKHQQYLKDGTTSIKMVKSMDNSLLTSCPYDPRVKKIKLKRGDRKPILDFDAKSGTSTWNSVDTHDTGASSAATNVKDVTWNSSVLRSPFEQLLSGPIKHSHQLKNIFNVKLEEPHVRITPYKSKYRTHQSVIHNIQCGSHASRAAVQPDSQNDRVNDSLTIPPNPFSDIISTSSQIVLSKKTSIPKLPSLNISTRMPSPWQHISSCNKPIAISHGIKSLWQHRLSSNKSIAGASHIQSNKLFCAAVPPPSPPKPQSSPNSSIENCTPSVSRLPSIPENPITNAENNRVKELNTVSQQLKQLQGSGWKKDWDGKWIKDENAEFDSDEEPPDIL